MFCWGSIARVPLYEPAPSRGCGGRLFTLTAKYWAAFASQPQSRASGFLPRLRWPRRFSRYILCESKSWPGHLVSPHLPCALFSLLAVIAYLRAFGRANGRHLGWIVAAWFLFLAAQLSKAVAVTLPFVLVVLDFAVLRRIRPGNWAGPSAMQAWREKGPFFALSVVFLVLAIFAKRSNDSLASIQNYGLAARIAQSCYGIAFYLAKTVWPVGLAAYYPLPRPESRLMSIPFVLGIPVVLLTTLVTVTCVASEPASVSERSSISDHPRTEHGTYADRQ